jgi:hypothetical protein
VNSAHGRLPLPAPATLSLLRGVPVYYVKEVQKELVTPTGAAILTNIAESFGGFPDMYLDQVGIGAGGYELPFPNIIRLWMGDSEEIGNLWVEGLVMVETNIDDMSPETHGYIMEKLFHVGALDVTFTPIHMKRNRPAIQLNVLCHPDQVRNLTSIIFSETTTLGIRQYPVKRTCLPRTIETVITPYGPIRMKIVTWDGKQRAKPEFEDCRIAAQKYQVPLYEIVNAAQSAFLAELG